MTVCVDIYDEGDGCSYVLTFSALDAENILGAELEVPVQLPSIGGSLCRSKNSAGIVYRNGSSGHGSISADYRKLCSDIRSQL